MLEIARKKVVEVGKALGFKYKQTYTKEGKRLSIKSARYDNSAGCVLTVNVGPLLINRRADEIGQPELTCHLSGVG